MVAVSYTHLDVYKRQNHGLTAQQAGVLITEKESVGYRQGQELKFIGTPYVADKKSCNGGNTAGRGW